MSGIVLKFGAVAAFVLFILYLAADAFRRARRLDERIRALRDEQDELTRQGRTQDPYAALAELYQERERNPRKR